MMPLTEVRDEPRPPTPPPDRNIGRIVMWLALAIAAAMLIMVVLFIALVAFGRTSEDSSTISASGADTNTSITLPEVTAPAPAASPETTIEADQTDQASTATSSATPSSTATTAAAGSVPPSTVAPTAPLTTGGGATRCSAAGLGPAPAQPGLPVAVAAMRSEILAAASGCDLEALAALGGPGFTADFGGGDPFTTWADLEAHGERPLWYLGQLLALPSSTITTEETTIHVWPAAYAADWQDVPAAEREALTAIYSPDELASFDELGGYWGYRIGIDQDGDWIFFVAGD